MIKTNVLLLGALALGLTAPGGVVPFPEARIFIEYNASANDLGFHVFLDAEHWEEVQIVHPNGSTIMTVEGEGGFGDLGLTELFFEGAEPNLDDVPLAVLLGLFPEGRYTFRGEQVDGVRLLSRPRLSHAIPAAPEVDAEVEDDTVTISWTTVSTPPPGFPNRPIDVVAYQVIVGSFQVTLPASDDDEMSLTLPPEFVASLEPGEQLFEVLAIEKSGNQTITEGDFEL
jgi:hypothetical protein